jgi:biopolymer transport protein ExbD
LEQKNKQKSNEIEETMAYKTPTSRKSKRKNERINLIPILDAVFIFIFFLLMSTQFVKVFEIGSDVPIISNTPPPKQQKKPLALTVEIRKNDLVVSTGIPSRVVTRVGKNSDGEYNLTQLHEFLVKLKKRNISEESVILEPLVDIKYEELVKIMDAIRMLQNTDDPIYTKDKDGIDVQVKTLFNKIVFGNIMS